MFDKFNREMKQQSEGYYIPPSEKIIGVKSSCMFENYQKDIYDFAISKCKQFRNSIDVGANIGVMTLRMMNTFESVQSFEPMLDDYLKANSKNNNIHSFGLGDSNQELTMQLAILNSGMTKIATRNKNNKDRIYNIEVKKLDSFKFTNVDFIKIDVEGYEWEVILGGKETIENNLPVLMIELHKDYKHKQRAIDYLKSLNYKMESFESDFVFWK